MDALQQELDVIAARPRCMVIGAKGRGFSAGHGLREMRSNPDKSYYQTLFRR